VPTPDAPTPGAPTPTPNAMDDNATLALELLRPMAAPQRDPQPIALSGSAP
jgi:hypothetical protein